MPVEILLPGMQKVLDFILGAKSELQKVNWPSRQALIQYTLIVVLISALVAIFLGALDSFFGYLVNRFLLSL